MLVISPTKQPTWMQLHLDITVLLQIIFSYLALLVHLCVDSRMPSLPNLVVHCVALNTALTDLHSQRTTEQFTVRLVAKLKRESLFRFAIYSFMSHQHTQVFCCLGKCLVGFWKGYFNQKRCRRRNKIQIRMEEYRFCTTLLSILIKPQKAQLSFALKYWNPVCSWITLSEQMVCHRVFLYELGWLC
jgi:hypothetical protein